MPGRSTALAGGVGVLIVTALMAVRGFGGPGAPLSYQIAMVALILLLLIGAWLLARFVRKHGDEIGEARFDTRNKDDTRG